MKIIFFSILLFSTNLILSQVGIGTSTPNVNSILDISANDKGILIPRLTTSQINLISVPSQSLMVFNSDVNLYYYYSTSNNSWMPINVGSISSVTATSYTLSPTDNGRILDFTSATGINLIVPNTLPAGFQVSVTQAGLGIISITGNGGMVVSNRWNAFRTSGQWAKVGIEVRAINSAIISGDLR